MLGYGRPAHAYDLAKLSGAVCARKAREGEICLALNGKEYALQPWMTVIADEAGVHDIAGIMGGEHSGCTDATTDVLLEVACFTPANIARTGQALALTSDARGRFERRGGPGLPRYRHGPSHQPDPRDLRRRGEPRDPGGRAAAGVQDHRL